MSVPTPIQTIKALAVRFRQPETTTETVDRHGERVIKVTRKATPINRRAKYEIHDNGTTEIKIADDSIRSLLTTARAAFGWDLPLRDNGDGTTEDAVDYMLTAAAREGVIVLHRVKVKDEAGNVTGKRIAGLWLPYDAPIRKLRNSAAAKKRAIEERRRAILADLGLTLTPDATPSA